MMMFFEDAPSWAMWLIVLALATWLRVGRSRGWWMRRPIVFYRSAPPVSPGPTAGRGLNACSEGFTAGGVRGGDMTGQGQEARPPCDD
jgi:hypothetical protein